jgi:protein-tyrosine phosphatase
VQQAANETVGRLALDGTFNTRWAGRAWLLRSAALDDLDEVGLDTLRTLGVRLVVDLRSAAERSPVVHGIPVVHVPVFAAAPPATGTLEAVYDGLLRTRGAALADAVAAIAGADGPVLVHCAVGKDRTGLVIALALLAAGATEDEVVSDYEASGAAVRDRRRSSVETQLDLLGLDADDRAGSMRLHLDSPAEALRHALLTLDALGGAEEYLRRHGLAEAGLAALRARRNGASDES